MAKKAKKDSASEFPETLFITINDRNDDGDPFFFANEESDAIDGSFHNDEEPYVAVYQLVKIQRFEKVERLVDLETADV